MSPSTADARPGSSCPSPASAFGLAIRSDEPVAGLSAPDAPPPGAPEVTLTRTARAQLDARWPAEGAVRLSAIRLSDGDPAPATIDRHPGAGYLLRSPVHGAFTVDPAAEVVRCAPGHDTWARYLHAQVLPLVAGLRGLELLHASAVTIGGRAVALCGPSGAGKTTLAALLRERGAAFLTDDVLALGRDAAGTVVAHPGPAWASVRDDRGEPAMVTVSDPSPSVALGAVAFLDRGAIASSVEVTPLSPSDPRPLLSGLYDVVRRDPARLTASLDLLAAVARQATLVHVRSAATTPPDQISDALLRALP